MIFMNQTIRSFLLALFLTCSCVLARASDPTAAAPAGSDDSLRRAVVGTWLLEKNLGVGSVAIYTTYREDGIAIEFAKIKFLFKKATGAWTEYRWSIQNGELHLVPLRFKTNTPDDEGDTEETVRQIVRIDQREMLMQRKGKDRKDTRSTIPADVQKMIDELSKS